MDDYLKGELRRQGYYNKGPINEMGEAESVEDDDDRIGYGGGTFQHEGHLIRGEMHQGG